MNSRQQLWKKLRPITANAVFLFAALLFLKSGISTNYSFITETTIDLLTFMAFVYLVIMVPFRLLSPVSDKKSKGELALIMLKKSLMRLHPMYYSWKGDERLEIKPEEKTALLFILVKFFFLPIMINFLIDHVNSLQHFAMTVPQQIPVGSLSAFNALFFPVVASLIFFIDVIYFTFGYIFEHEKLNNVVRSVEPTFFGWFVTMACYPPFNFATGHLFGWYASDFAFHADPYLTLTLNTIGLFLFTIYVWATVALGTKCSNLTNRGIIDRGPYAVIRHPAYISKNMAWWLTVIPTFNPVAYMSMAAWTSLYFFRAITEERHLLADPDYQEYVKKVKYQFIPGIW